ncbi:hypothetical protein MMC34_000374 [Xylographa carneopallida]|nr:hypothetical protein [Xylographa carneopallida]
MRAFSPFRSYPASQASPILPLHTSNISPPIPQPIASVLLPPPAALNQLLNSIADTSSDGATLRALARQTAHLERTLQSLLDAQSVGLLSGLGNPPQDIPPSPAPTNTRRRVSASPRRYHDVETPSSDEGSRTPTTRASSASRRASIDSYSNPSARTHAVETLRYRDVPIPTQRKAPTQKRVGLQAARKGILRGLHDLVEVKAQEEAVLAAQLSQHEDTLTEMEAAEAKRRGIMGQIEAIERDGREGMEAVGKLEREERNIERAILETEERLAELRVRLKRVRARREEGGNKLDARLSSWRAALEDLERGVGERWLGDKGAELRKAKGVWALPRERRTLGLVCESVKEEKGEIEGKLDRTEREREACARGAEVWTDVVATIAEVERRLKSELRSTTSPEKPTIGLGERNGEEEIAAEVGMEAMLQHMTRALSILCTRLELAETQGWKLLVCSIGAEVEGLREGREMLLSALSQSALIPDTGDSSSLDEMVASQLGGGLPGRKGEDAPSGDQGSTLPSSASQSFYTTKEAMLGRSVVGLGDETTDGSVMGDLAGLREGGVERSEDEDDEPGPDFLIEH